MILKLARLVALEKLSKPATAEVIEHQEKAIHVPRPLDEQKGRLKAPVRIISQ